MKNKKCVNHNWKKANGLTYCAICGKSKDDHDTFWENMANRLNAYISSKGKSENKLAPTNFHIEENLSIANENVYNAEKFFEG